MTKKIVWTFTNKKSLTASEFVDYFQRKVFRTIRKCGGLPEDYKEKGIKVLDDGSLNFEVLRFVLEQKFLVNVLKSKGKGVFVAENMSDVAEDSFENFLKGKFEGKMLKDSVYRPLYFLSDEEVELYAKLKGIKWKLHKRNNRVQSLFERFKKNNPDLEHNIVNAVGQLESLKK